VVTGSDALMDPLSFFQTGLGLAIKDHFAGPRVCRDADCRKRWLENQPDLSCRTFLKLKLSSRRSVAGQFRLDRVGSWRKVDLQIRDAAIDAVHLDGSPGWIGLNRDG